MILYILLFFLTFSSVHTMEQQKPFNLEELPSDIQNEIAQYLTFQNKESDAEFIERTKAIICHGINKLFGGNTTIEHFNKELRLENHHYPMFYSRQLWTLKIKDLQNKKEIRLFQGNETYMPIEHYIGHSPYISKVVHAMKISLSTSRKVKVYNTENSMQNETSCVLCEFDSETEFYAITVSLDGEHIAYIVENEDNTSTQSNYIIKYKKLNKENPVLLLSKPCTLRGIPIAIHFNKQGTKVIIYDNSNNNTIVQLVDNEIHASKSQKTLREYFAQRGICKNLKCAKTQ